MIIKPVPANLLLPASAVPRSQGIHVSNIIRCIATEEGLLKAETVEELALTDVREIRDPVALLRIAIGLAWEEWYIRSVLSVTEGVLDHPLEMCVDGIYMTHDGESIDVIITLSEDGTSTDTYKQVIHEIKATSKSINTVGDVSKEWMWLTQVKAYCRGKHTLYAKLHVLFLYGDYKFPIAPQLKCWDLTFTQQEIDENWEMLREYRDYRLQKEK